MGRSRRPSTRPGSCSSTSRPARRRSPWSPTCVAGRVPRPVIRHARPVRDRAPDPALRARDEPPGSLHEARQALRHDDRPQPAHRPPATAKASWVSRTSRWPGTELEQALAGLRGAVELPIPAASAVKIDGERAYKSASARGRGRDAAAGDAASTQLESVRDDGGTVELELHVGSGTYIRSIADALGGHCVALRRTHHRAVRRRRGGRAHRGRPRRGAPASGRLGDAAMKIAHAPSQLDRQPRAVAIGTFDGVHRGHLSVLRSVIDSGLEPTVITFDPHPRIAMGNRVELVSTLERRLELLGDCGRGGDPGRPFHPGAAAAGAGGVRRDLSPGDRSRGDRRGA